MSKYGLPIDYSDEQNGSDIRFQNITDIPDPLPDWAENAQAFVEKMYPDFSGFVELTLDQYPAIPEPEPVPEPAEPTLTEIKAKLAEVVALVNAL